jgi:hypothetical protein
MNIIVVTIMIIDNIIVLYLGLNKFLKDNWSKLSDVILTMFSGASSKP